jgi:protein SCO1/2
MIAWLLPILAARADIPLPPGLADVGVRTRAGAHVDLDLAFQAEDGSETRLGAAFDGEHPVVLALAWYRCKMVCGLLLSGLADAAAQVDPPPGPTWRLLTVSYDAADTVDDAREARHRARDRFGGAVPWEFWVGESGPLAALRAELGVRVAKDPRSGEIAHPVVVFVLSGDGVVTQVLHGPSVDAGGLAAAIAAARTFPTPTIPPGNALVCAHPEDPPAVYRAWVQAAGMTGLGVVALALLAARRARR